MKKDTIIICAVIIMAALAVVLTIHRQSHCPPPVLDYVHQLYVELADGKEVEDWDKKGMNDIELKEWAQKMVKPGGPGSEIYGIINNRITDTVEERRSRCELFLRKYDR